MASSLASLGSEKAGTACQVFEGFRTAHGRLYHQDGYEAEAHSPHPESQVRNVHVQLMHSEGIREHFHVGASCICSFLERKATWQLSGASLLLAPCHLSSLQYFLLLLLLLILLLFFLCKVATKVLALRFEAPVFLNDKAFVDLSQELATGIYLMDEVLLHFSK